MAFTFDVKKHNPMIDNYNIKHRIKVKRISRKDSKKKVKFALPNVNN